MCKSLAAESMKKYYEIAGIGFEIERSAENMFADERTLAPFRIEEVTDPHRFSFEFVEQLKPPIGGCMAAEAALQIYAIPGGTVRYIGAMASAWDSAYIRVEHRDKEHWVQLKKSAFPGGAGSKTVLNSLAAEHLVAKNGGFVFHSSYIEYGGNAILFTAPSGTGKSTQAALWERYRSAEIINGDRSAVRFLDGEAVACGIPFAGSSNICKNKTLPLAAIVYLKQAPENRIRRLRGAEAFRRIWEGCSVNTWDKDDVAAVSDTVQQVIGAVPVYELACTPDESAVSVLEETLKQEGIL